VTCAENTASNWNQRLLEPSPGGTPRLGFSGVNGSWNLLWPRMRRDDGRLLHTSKDVRARLDAYLEDSTNLLDGLTRLCEATGEPRWIESALELARVLIDEFSDPAHGGFFYRSQGRPRGRDSLSELSTEKGPVVPKSRAHSAATVGHHGS
jgi:hypothetical protein